MIRIDFKLLAEKHYAFALKHRIHLHQYPELSFQEFETANYIESQLNHLGLETNRIGTTGVTAIIKSSRHNHSDECIALRADIDALPIHEANDVPYKSKTDGIMHACGHDVHSSILLGTAAALMEIKEELPHPIKLIFQPGEEKNPGGASILIKEGVLENPKVKSIFGLHVAPDLPVGEFGMKAGEYMASCDEIHLTIKGKGGHAAMPHLCVDSIYIASQLIVNLQQIVSRKCDPKIPSVLSFGHFEALGATNIIPDKVHIKGTFRTFDERWRSEALEIIEKNIISTCELNGASVDLLIDRGYPVLHNDSTLTSSTKAHFVKHFGNEKIHDLPIRLSSEDFSFYSQHVPACFFRLGVANPNKETNYNVHHPKFDIHEKALQFGIESMLIAATNLK